MSTEIRNLRLDQHGPSLFSDADDMFNKSITPTWLKPSSPQSTNAPLDPLTIDDLLSPVFRCHMHSVHSTVTSTECRVLYGADMSGYSGRSDTLFVELCQCETALAAEAKMKDYLRSFESLSSEVAKPAGLGSHSLHTLVSVFWIRDTAFVKMFVGESVDITGVPADPSNAPRKPVLDMILQAARLIDQHLASHAGSPRRQTRPRLVLEESSVTVEEGQIFVAEVADSKNFHDAKASEIQDPDLVVQVENASASGVYKFLALGTGKTKIKLLLADASTLAVASLDVDVRISRSTPSTQEDQHHPVLRHYADEDKLPYLLEEIIGQGAFSVVQRAVHQLSKEIFACKIIMSPISGRENAEIETLTTLRHKHIVHIVEAFAFRQQLYIIMKPLADGDLAWYLGVWTDNGHNSGALKRAFGCLSSGLAYLHERRVLHNDISPANILWNNDSCILSGFGLSTSGHTSSALSAGTARYMPPEAVGDEPRRTYASDIFSLGCVFYEILATMEPIQIPSLPYPEAYRQHIADLRVNLEMAVSKDLGLTPVLACCIMMLEPLQSDRITADSLVSRLADGEKLTNESFFCSDCLGSLATDVGGRA